MGLIEHARFELEREGLFDKDSDYNGEIGKAVMEIVEVFSKQGHSGYSAMIVTEIINKLLRYKTIGVFTPSIEDSHEISSNPLERQSTRRGDVFTKDGGGSWYSIDTDERWPVKFGECELDIKNKERND